MYIIFMLLFTCGVTPYRLAFFIDQDDPLHWKIINYCVDGSFAVDMVFTFFSAYYDTETTIVGDRKKICKQYMCGWFAIDFMSIFPFEAILASGDFAGLVRIFRVSKIYKIVKIARLVRIFKFMKQR